VDRRAWLVAVLLALAVGVPFLGKAFHIDDAFVLSVTDQILREPLRPFHGEINWRSDPLPILEVTKNPPLLSYYLAPWVKLCGPSEHVLHASMLLFLVLLAVGAGLLGRWFWVGEWWPMLFVLLSPAVVVQTNVMRDVPAAALATLGLALFVLGTDEDRRAHLAWGAVLLGLATVTKYSAAALVPLLVLYPLLHRKWRYALWTLVPLAILGLWCLQNWLSLGQVHILVLLRQRAAGSHGFTRPWHDKAVAGLVVLGSMLFLLPAVVIACLRRRVWLLLPLLAAVGVGVVFAVHARFGSPSLATRPHVVVLDNGSALSGKLVAHSDAAITLHTPGRPPRTLRAARVARVEKLSWQHTLWAATGGMLLVAVVAGALVAALRGLRAHDGSSADWLFLLAWLAAGMLFSVFIVPFQATRHILPILAPAVVLVLRLLGTLRRPVKIALVVLLVLQAAVAYLVGAADAEHAGAYRQFAAHAANKHRRPDHDLWFNGHWGWQHYALAHGLKQLSHSGTPPKPGDLVLDPKWVHRVRYPKGLRKELVDEVPYPARLPVRTMDMAYSCFYSVTAHRVPYRFTLDETPVQIGRIYRVLAPKPPSPQSPSSP